MAKRVHYHPNLILSVGTQVVTLKDVVGQNGRTLHPRGSVGVVVKAPRDLEHSYRVRFPGGVEEPLKPSELTLLAKFKEGEIEANLVRLNETFKLPCLTELIDRKISGTEKGTLDQTDLSFHEQEYEQLRTELEKAFEQSDLPEQPSGTAALNDLLIRLRLRRKGGA